MIELDTSDVDKWVGKPLGGGRLKDPIVTNDIRRWAQGMQNPNPLYYDEEYALDGSHSEFIAPQSFGICTDTSHGAGPAIQGVIPGQHMIFGGDEWWFYGPRIRPGDSIRHERMLFDYKVSNTSFAGPTMFSRGDTVYINQKGEIIGKQRSTSVRYLVENATKLGLFADNVEREWTDQEIADLEKKKMDYIQSFRDLGHDKRLFVKVGDKLTQRPIGPHSIASFTTEWRSYLMTIWGSWNESGVSSTTEAGWLPEMSRDKEGAKVDPTYGDGLIHGPSRGHVQPRYAKLIGMPRGYGYGATMGAWIIDFLTNWGGEWSFVTYSNMQYRAPAFTGDITYIDAQVKAISDTAEGPLATIQVVMTNQDDTVMAKGTAEMLLPTP